MYFLYAVAKFLGVLSFLLPFAELFAVTVFTLALQTVRVRARSHEVRVHALDPVAALGVGLASAIAVVALWACGACSLWWLCALPLLIYGCQVRIQVNASGAHITRRALYVISWSSQALSLKDISFACDGWGDFIDPEELRVVIDPHEAVVLGWSTKGSGDRAEVLAATFNAGVAEVLQRVHTPSS